MGLARIPRCAEFSVDGFRRKINVRGVKQNGVDDMALSDQFDSFAAVWEVVRQWPASKRRSLASQLLASLSPEQAAPSAKTHPAVLIGAWRDADPLDDDAAQALLEDELLRKHG